jgi:hypothetical protein
VLLGSFGRHDEQEDHAQDGSGAPAAAGLGHGTDRAGRLWANASSEAGDSIRAWPNHLGRMRSAGPSGAKVVEGHRVRPTGGWSLCPPAGTGQDRVRMTAPVVGATATRLRPCDGHRSRPVPPNRRPGPGRLRADRGCGPPRWRPAVG